MPIFDCEGNGIYPDKFYVLSYWNGSRVVSLTTHEDMKKWLLSQKTLVGHNIGLWDIPNLERVLDIKIKAKIIDTLFLSWYLYPERHLHGLESWGEYYYLSKKEIVDWHNLSLKEYIERCERDVEINLRLWEDQQKYLSSLYETNDVENLPIIGYLRFKMKCAALQEKSGWALDKKYCQESLEKLEAEREKKIAVLKSIMPVVVKRVLKNPPPKPYKKDGTLSVEGAKWQKYLSEQGLTKDHSLPIYVEVGKEEANPNSSDQVKSWLFSIGWIPETFKFVKEDGVERSIPQVKKANSPDLCSSITALIEEHPEVEHLEGLSVLSHRIGILKGFLSNEKDGVLQARISGLTNTLRFKHTEIVNLPGVDKPYGKEVRGCLVARPGYILVGTDMVSLEDTTKRHYMYPYDPEYVEEMSKEGFDPHLDLAITAKVLTKAQVENHKKGVEDHSKIRKSYKVVNYSSIYGIGAAKLARELKSSVSFAKNLLDIYWKRNWSVKKIAEDCIVKRVNNQDWLFNPVSKFWYSLRNEKDRFSTLNQGTGVYCFDTWVSECLKQREQLTAQFHDEICCEVEVDHEKKLQELQQKAIDRVNAKLKLNVTLYIDSKSGHRYSDIH